MSGDYSEVAAAQLDELESSASDALWDAVLDACDLALNHPSHAQKYSAAITTSEGDIVFRLVVGHVPYQGVLGAPWRKAAHRGGVPASVNHAWCI